MADQPYVPPGGPPQTPAPRVYDKVGSDRMYDFARVFYRLLAESEIQRLFPPTEEELEIAATKQAEFLIGVLGGPGIYMQKYGHPRMRARHLPFVIDEAARREWLRCFHQAFRSCDGWGLPEEDQETLLRWIEGFSGWMVNRKDTNS